MIALVDKMFRFAYASLLAVQLTSAASYVISVQNDSLNKAIRALCFFLIAPALIIFLNLRRVYVSLVSLSLTTSSVTIHSSLAGSRQSAAP